MYRIALNVAIQLDRALVLLYLDGNRYDTIAEVPGIQETNVGAGNFQALRGSGEALRGAAAASAGCPRGTT